jgi:uncharacterized protein (TIGR02145 family)
MTENLKTTRYSNGDLIGTTSPATFDISGESTPEYQWAYAGDDNNVAIYGRLYTWFVATDSRNVCPISWHVPTLAEWTVLFDYLTNNGYGYEGSGDDIGKSLAAKFAWPDYALVGSIGNDQATNNSSGFTALPGGYRTSGFDYDTVFGAWWTSSNGPGISASMMFLLNSWVGPDITYNYKRYGYSIRCLKDQ